MLSFGTVCACVPIVDKYMVGVGGGPAALRMMYVESPLLDNALCWIYGNSNVIVQYHNNSFAKCGVTNKRKNVNTNIKTLFPLA